MDFHVSDYYDEEGERDKHKIKENRSQKIFGDEMGKRLGRAAGDQSWESGDWGQQTGAVTLISADSRHRGDGPHPSSGHSQW